MRKRRQILCLFSAGRRRSWADFHSPAAQTMPEGPQYSTSVPKRIRCSHCVIERWALMTQVGQTWWCPLRGGGDRLPENVKLYSHANDSPQRAAPYQPPISQVRTPSSTACFFLRNLCRRSTFRWTWRLLFSEPSTNHDDSQSGESPFSPPTGRLRHSTDAAKKLHEELCKIQRRRQRSEAPQRVCHLRHLSVKATPSALNLADCTFNATWQATQRNGSIRSFAPG